MLQLIEWYNRNKRKLPWRNTNDAYKIWISEVILQQTRVAQGLAYYLKFIERFPDVSSLASANIDELMRLWQGLGYYSRAKNLLTAARQVVEQFDGKFPETVMDLKKLKGVGDYTAAAVASISFNLPAAAVDGNVYRVLSRIYAIDEPVNTTKGKQMFQQLATKLIDKKNPGTFNQAMMELGALLCLPKKPLCHICPVNEKCLSFASGSIARYPVKNKKPKQKKRYFYYYVINNKNNTFICKRISRDIWHNLYNFPLIEESRMLTGEQILSAIKKFSWLKCTEKTAIGISEEFRHVLTHQVILARFVRISGADIDKTAADKVLEIEISALDNYAMPRLITRYLEKHPLATR
ncbi:MAG: A/G-specific adenine glycosylase [Bacteroidales bacterium]|nr:A/G-specific adenine glycosylase [Bacteroidales bacterium]